MVGQIEFNDIKTYDDFGFLIDDIIIENPSPNLVLQTVPYQSGVYDFTEVGGLTYSTRLIKVKLKLEKYESYQNRLNVLYYNFINRLNSTGMRELKISWIEGIFKSRVQSISDFILLEEERIIEVIFLSQPFRTHEIFEGNDLWDTFNFENGVFQTTKYEITEETNITLYNLSATKVFPEIICSNAMSILYNNITYNIPSGTNKNILRLEKGENTLRITGVGTIEFKWKREVI